MALDATSFATQSATICREFILRTYVPEVDVARTLAAVTEIVPLRYGSYTDVAFQSTVGIQRFRPVAGSHIGDAQEIMEFPVVEVVFSIPHDEDILRRVIDRIFSVHIAEEPVIYIDEGWSTRARDYADKSNPNRFWNRPDFDDRSKW